MIKKVVLDTDLGSDADDVGALALANLFHNRHIIDLLAVTYTTSSLYGPLAVSAVNTFYGNKDIPIGLYHGPDFLKEEIKDNYPTPVVEHFPHKNLDEMLDAVKLLRKILSENKDVTLIFIGQLLNLHNLMLSNGDEISHLSGLELINQSVKEIYIMGGLFPEITGIECENKGDEYNLLTAKDASYYVFKHLTVPTKIVDGTLGAEVVTGAKGVEKFGDKNVVSYAYARYIYRNPDGSRFSWDPITVYRACIQDDLFKEVGPGTVTLSEPCRTTYKDDPNGNFYIVKANKDYQEIANRIDEWLCEER